MKERRAGQMRILRDEDSAWVPCPSLAQPGAGMFPLGMAALRLAMAPEKPAASEH